MILQAHGLALPSSCSQCGTGTEAFFNAKALRLPERKTVDTQVSLNNEALDAVRASAEELFRAMQGALISGKTPDGGKAIIDFAQTLGNAMLGADRLAWMRVLDDAAVSGEMTEYAAVNRLRSDRRFAAVFDAGYAPSPEEVENWLNLPWQDAEKEITSKEPVLAKSYKQAAAAYQRKAFYVARSTALGITKKIQSYLAGAFNRKDQIEARKQGKSFDVAKEIQKLDPASFSMNYVKTVARTNLASAYSAGREQAAREASATGQVVGMEFLSALLPTTRPNHKAGHKWRAVLRHPAWQGHTPPLGYNCFCSKRTLFRPEAKRNGWLTHSGTLIPLPVPAGFAADSSQGGGKNFGGQPDLSIYRS